MSTATTDVIEVLKGRTGKLEVTSMGEQGPGGVPSPRSLDELAHLANAAHAQVEQLAGAALERAREAGEALAEAKIQLPHGAWGAWLRENFHGSPRTARLYMQVAARWPELEAKRQRVANLSLRQAVGLLEKPSTRALPAPAQTGERMEQHPAVRGLVPEWYKEPAFPGLLESIRKWGCLNPIICDQKGRIIDGWLRYHACLVAGVGFRVDIRILDDPDDAWEVLRIWCSQNIYRQHLSQDQKTMVAAKAEAMQEDEG